MLVRRQLLCDRDRLARVVRSRPHGLLVGRLRCATQALTRRVVLVRHALAGAILLQPDHLEVFTRALRRDLAIFGLIRRRAIELAEAFLVQWFHLFQAGRSLVPI